MPSNYKLWWITSSTETASSAMKQLINSWKSSEHSSWRCILKCLLLWLLCRAMEFSTVQTKLEWWKQWDQLNLHPIKISEVQQLFTQTSSFDNKCSKSSCYLVTKRKQRQVYQNCNTDKSFGTFFKQGTSSCPYKQWVKSLSMFWLDLEIHQLLKLICKSYGRILHQMLLKRTPLVLALA